MDTGAVTRGSFYVWNFSRWTSDSAVDRFKLKSITGNDTTVVVWPATNGARIEPPFVTPTLMRHYISNHTFRITIGHFLKFRRGNEKFFIEVTLTDSILSTPWSRYVDQE